MEAGVKTLLHVGCGRGKLPYGYGAYHEVRLDCDPAAEPDVLASVAAMPMVADGSFDLVFASHVLEHLHFHEVGMALAEFRRVLKPGGVLEVFVPDLQGVGGKIALDELDVPVYLSGYGPVTPLDMLYGHRGSVAKGEWAMAHKTGFTASVLKSALLRAGFRKAVTDRAGGLELKASAIKEDEPCQQSAKCKDVISQPTSGSGGCGNTTSTTEASCQPA